MAEVTNAIEGPAHLAIRIDMLERVHGPGMVSHGSICMNAALGVVRAYVTFIVGNQEIFGGEVFLHRLSLVEWKEQVVALVEGDMEGCKCVSFPMESPELMMCAQRFDSNVMGGPASYYELMAALDVGILDSNMGLTSDGPGIYLNLEPEALVQFSDDLLHEADVVLCTTALFGSVLRATD